MKIIAHRIFNKQFKKLPQKIKDKTEKTIQVFSKNPRHLSLKNHALTGRMKALRAISVTGNIRIVFQEFDNYIVVIFLSIGGHDNVYKT